MPLSEQDIALIEEQLDFTIEDLIKNPSEYGISNEGLDTLEDFLVNLSEGSYETFVKAYNSMKIISDRQKLPPPPSGLGNSSDERTFTKKDKAGNVIFENGEPLTVTVKLDDFFPSANFYDTFYQTHYQY